jgi:hypothetical protein
MILSAIVLTTIAVPQAQACASNDERGSLVHSANPTPAFEAGSAAWFVNSDKIAYAGGSYAKYGLPRVLKPDEIEPVADKGGVPLFIEAGNYSAAPEVIYVMVRSADCSFQPYSRG